jgi:hypothetical protein
MIGGMDFVFWTPDQDAAVRDILRIVCRRWKDYVFQNADDLAPMPPLPPGILPTPTGDQFFLYRDESAARSWEEFGAIPENANTMLHVLVGKRRQPGTDYHSLTVVCDEAVGETREILDEIEAALRAEGRNGDGTSVALPGVGVRG